MTQEDPRGPLHKHEAGQVLEKAPMQVVSYYVLTPDGDRPFPWRNLSPEFEATLPEGSRVYELHAYIRENDKVGDEKLVTLRRIR